MAVEYLESIDDPRLAPYRKLAAVVRPEVTPRFVVEGRFLVERLLESPLETESIVTDAARAVALAERAGAGIDLLVLPPAAINQLVGFAFHRGMLACGRRPTLPQVGELIPALGRPALLVLCENVVDPANLGGILRNCAAFGADAVLLGAGCADPYSRRVLRVSMGAALTMQIGITEHLPAVLQPLANLHQVEPVAAVVDADAEPLGAVERIHRVALVIGNEGTGLSREAVAACRRKVTIPIQAAVDSLNVAVASGLFLYHLSQFR